MDGKSDKWSGMEGKREREMAVSGGGGGGWRKSLLLAV